jgi:hypothetical protein
MIMKLRRGSADAEVVTALAAAFVSLSMFGHEMLTSLDRAAQTAGPAQAKKAADEKKRAADEKRKKAVEAKVKKSLEDLSRESAKSMAARLKAAKADFEKARGNAPEFAEEALSWQSKWELTKEHLGLSAEGSHERFLRAKFEEKVCSPDGLKRALEGAVNGFLTELEGLEAEWLVKLRADVSDEDLALAEALPHLKSEEAFKAEYRKLAREMLPVLAKDLKVEVVRQVASFAIGEIGTQLAVQIAVSAAAEMGVSAGVLGAGAMSGVATFGVGLAVCFLVDHWLGEVLKEAGYDPQREIAGKVKGSLDRLEGVAVDGDKGLKGHIRKLHQLRCKLREKAIQKLLKTGDLQIEDLEVEGSGRPGAGEPGVGVPGVGVRVGAAELWGSLLPSGPGVGGSRTKE